MAQLPSQDSSLKPTTSANHQSSQCPEQRSKPSKFDLAELKSNPFIYRKALAEVLRLENEEIINSARSFVVHFEVKYRSSWGQVIKAVGNCDALGNWRADRGLELHYSPGDLWVGQAFISDVPMNTIEFKYAVVAEGRTKWELGYNRRAVLNDGAEKIDGQIVRTFRHEWRGKELA